MSLGDLLKFKGKGLVRLHVKPDGCQDFFINPQKLNGSLVGHIADESTSWLNRERIVVKTDRANQFTIGIDRIETVEFIPAMLPFLSDREAKLLDVLRAAKGTDMRVSFSLKEASTHPPLSFNRVFKVGQYSRLRIRDVRISTKQLDYVIEVEETMHPAGENFAFTCYLSQIEPQSLLISNF